MRRLEMILSRLAWFVPTLAGLVIIVFLISNVIPTDPVRVLLLPEQREVGADPGRVEHHVAPLRPPRVRSARRPRITRSSSSRTAACSIRPRISAANP